jgi:uncharacterized protein YndB with AHSA1/START domain
MEPLEDRSDARSKTLGASPAAVFDAMSDPIRIARWWGPAGFTNTIHEFEFSPGGRWLLTMHGPDGRDYPNESRFTRIEADRLLEIEHLCGHHFVLAIELEPKGGGTEVKWRQTFDTVEHYRAHRRVRGVRQRAEPERLAAEVHRGKNAA